MSLKTKSYHTLLSILAGMIPKDPWLKKTFIGSSKEEKVEKDPTSPESIAKMEKANAKRKRKGEKLAADFQKMGRTQNND